MKTGAYLRNILFSLLVGAGLLALGLHFTGAARASQSPARFAALSLAQPQDRHQGENAAAAPLNPGPDLIIQSIRTVPTYPNPGEPVNIEIVIKNVGDAKAVPVGDLIITALYVDLHREPQLGDLDTSYTGLFSLDAGKVYVWTYKNYDKFTTAGCDHDIWAWTDRGSNVIEDNETQQQALDPSLRGHDADPAPSSDLDANADRHANQDADPLCARRL